MCKQEISPDFLHLIQVRQCDILLSKKNQTGSSSTSCTIQVLRCFRDEQIRAAAVYPSRTQMAVWSHIEVTSINLPIKWCLVLQKYEMKPSWTHNLESGRVLHYHRLWADSYLQKERNNGNKQDACDKWRARDLLTWNMAAPRTWPA